MGRLQQRRAVANMNLATLLDTLPPELAVSQRISRPEAPDPLIRGITYDSRKVAPGDLFIALRGSVADGHDYLERAIELGAVALLVEEAPPVETLGEAVAVVVADTRRAMSRKRSSLSLMYPRFDSAPTRRAR